MNEHPVNEPYKPNARETRIQIIKFALFSASAGIALGLSVLWNFTLNREFTFKSANNVSKAMMQIFLFYCVFTPLSTWWGNVLTEKAGWNSYAVLFLTMATNLISEYIYDRFVVYRNSMNTNRRAQREEERSELK